MHQGTRTESARGIDMGFLIGSPARAKLSAITRVPGLTVTVGGTYLAQNINPGTWMMISKTNLFLKVVSIVIVTTSRPSPEISAS